MNRRLSRTERRRALLARRVNTLERLESRNMIMDGSGMIFMGLPGTAALVVPQPVETTPHQQQAGWMTAPVPYLVPDHLGASTQVGDGDTRTQSAPSELRAPQCTAAPGDDWITLLRPGDQAQTAPRLAPSHSSPAAAKGGGAAQAPRGGSSGALPGTISPLRLPARRAAAPPTISSPSVVVGPSTPLTAASQTITAQRASVAAPDASAPTTTGSGAMVTGPTMQQSASSSPTSDSWLVTSNVSGPTQGQFQYFELYTLDYNDGTVLFPGADQLATLASPVDLRAQVRGTTVSSYSWDTTNLTHATSISGTSTSNLTFDWTTSNSAEATDSVTLTVTDTNGHQEVQTYSFVVPAGDRTGGVSGAIWPNALEPNLVLPGAPAFSSQNASVDANSGALDTTIALPTYNPNVPGLSLTYNSVTADPRPIFVDHHQLDPALSVPSQVSAQLTFDGTVGTTYYYDTSQFIPGDIQQIALQADATGLSTGRYGYSLSIGDIRGTTTTTIDSGTATVLNYGSNAFGAGWTLQGLEQITAASGGVILDLGGGDKSLWFTGSFGSGGGTYIDPGGEFSTLVQNSNGTYTRTLTDGTQVDFNSTGQEVALVDRNGLHTTFAYSSGNLSTITDPYGNITTFTYSGGVLQTITDPANRVTSFTHSGNDLTGVTLPDSSSWNYGYDSSGRMTSVTDPNSRTASVAYDSADRVSTITRPDNSVETFRAYQESGWTDSGTSLSPATATLLAEATANYTDPLGHETQLRPDWNGEGMTDESTDPSGNVTTYDRDVNGLATIIIDRLNRITQQGFDGSGNLDSITHPDGTQELSGYNSFAEPTSYTNENSETTYYTYDAHGNLTVIKDPLTNLTTMTYTADGKLATVEDARNNVTTYQYDTQDRLTTVIYPDGSTTLYGYDREGNRNSMTDGNGHTTTFAFDGLNRETGMTDPLGNATTYVYDSGGNQVAVEAPLGRTTSYAYDPMNRLTTLTDPLGHATVTAYDSGGNIVTVTDPLGRVTSYQYDPENRPTVVTDPLGNSTTTVYDAEGQVLTVTDPLGRVTTNTYDSRGWKATVTDPLGNTTTYSYTNTGKPATESVYFGVGSMNIIAYSYDANDRLVTVEDALNDTTTYTYDSVGNRTAVTDPNGNTTSYLYDSRNRVTTIVDPLSHSTVYGYDNTGNRITVTDPLGHTTTTQYDALNRVTTVTNALGAQTVYSYDAAGRQTAVVDPDGNRTTFAYDAADRLTTVTDPNGSTVTYLYDNANQLIDQTDQDGRRTTFAYDSGGRKTGETWVGSSPSEVITYTYDADGELTGVTDANATLTFTYDSGGRQITAATSGSGGQPSVTLSSGYDNLGNRTSLADNLANAGLVSFSYDSVLRLTTITTTYGGSSGPQVVFGYDSGSRLTSESRSIGGGYTEVNTTFSYDNANRLTTVTDGVDAFDPFNGWSDTPLATYVYGYDNANRLVSEQDAEGTATFSYDNANELTGVSGSRAETYTYDSGGNRTMTGYSVGTDNEMTASPGYTYTYDDAGNLVSQTETATHTVTTYTYDYDNRLTAVEVGGTAVATYTYDALGRRMGVDDNGTQTWTVYDGQNPYADFDGSGTLQERYLYGPAIDQLLARTNSGGASAWYLTDRLGSVRDVVDATGNVLDHIVYDSFGNVLSESNPSNGDRFKFAGMELDTQAALYFDRARFYNQSFGLFLTEDPKGFAAGDPNLYRYVGNGPTDQVDPTGLDATDLQPGPQDAAGQAVQELRADLILNAQREVDLQAARVDGLGTEINAALMEWKGLKADFDKMMGYVAVAETSAAIWTTFAMVVGDPEAATICEAMALASAAAGAVAAIWATYLSSALGDKYADLISAKRERDQAVAELKVKLANLAQLTGN